MCEDCNNYVNKSKIKRKKLQHNSVETRTVNIYILNSTFVKLLMLFNILVYAFLANFKRTKVH